MKGKKRAGARSIPQHIRLHKFCSFFYWNIEDVHVTAVAEVVTRVLDDTSLQPKFPKPEHRKTNGTQYDVHVGTKLVIYIPLQSAGRRERRKISFLQPLTLFMKEVFTASDISKSFRSTTPLNTGREGDGNRRCFL